MSFRHTYITEFLYKYNRSDELSNIEATLARYGTVDWKSSINDSQLGYFHGVIKDSNGYDMSHGEGDKIIKELGDKGVKMAIVYE